MPTLSFHTSSAVEQEVRVLAARQGVGPSALVGQLVEEGLRMRRFPGVLFRDGATGRRAALAGSLDLWEVIAIMQDFAEDEEAILAAYPALSALQLKTARVYYAQYPEEIDARIAFSRQSEEEGRHSFPALFTQTTNPSRTVKRLHAGSPVATKDISQKRGPRKHHRGRSW